MTVFRRKLRLHLLAGAALAVAVVWVAAASAANPISIPDAPDCTISCTLGTIMSSTLTIPAGAPSGGTIKVKLIGFNHDSPSDVDLLLESPVAGQNIILMSDAASDQSTGGPLSFTFADNGTTLPCDNNCSAGFSLQDGFTYKPRDYDGGDPNDASNICVLFPNSLLDAGDPASFTGTQTLLSGLAANPVGTWTLKAVDDCGEDNSVGPFGGGGEIQGWCMTINSTSYGCPATSVSVLGMSARRLGTSAQLSWRTAQETSVVGFNIYRIAAGKTARVNKVLVRAKNGARGASYRLTDRTLKARVAYRYRLQVVGLDGSRTWAASTTLRAG